MPKKDTIENKFEPTKFYKHLQIIKLEAKDHWAVARPVSYVRIKIADAKLAQGKIEHIKCNIRPDLLKKQEC